MSPETARLEAEDFARLEQIALASVVDVDELRGLAFSMGVPRCAELAGFG